MSLEKASISWSAKQVKNMVANGKIDFGHIIQRSYVWERKRKTALIESMILGYPIPPIFSKRAAGEKTAIYSIMDGKQRLSTIAQFLQDEFTLSDLSPVTYHNDEDDSDYEEDISGMKFSELPEPIQDNISSTMLTITYFENLTPTEERELFKRLNAGKPLSTKSRLLASCNNIEYILDIGSHEIFNDMLTDKARENKNQATLVMKAWCMLNKSISELSFESKVFNALFETIDITEEQRATLDETFGLYKEVHDNFVVTGVKKIAKKLYTEVHFISLVPFIHECAERNIDAESICEWLSEFFTNDTGLASVSDEYNAASNSGSARNASIIARNKILKNSFDGYFSTDVESNAS
jgi:uncharacterized protein with ParB-like and HNH nuclease domain